MSIEELYKLYLSNPSVQTDTRKLKPGDLFFALKGENFNGNAFAKNAIDHGASRAIIDEKEFEIKGKTILTENVLQTLQDLALHHRKQFIIPFFAITGSNGKTTTKELVHAVLSSHYKTYTTEGNLNNHIGVPLTILKIKEDAEIAVIEMGANHIGEIASYCRYALHTHGLITNCGKAHLEGFGSEEGVRKGKGELYDHLRTNGGTAFVMWDYKYLHEMSKGIKTIITYGTAGADVVGHAIENKGLLKVEIENKMIIQTQLVGDYNLPNVLAAITVGIHFNVPADKIKAAIENYSPSNSRSQLMEKESNRIILDAYNANPSSMQLAIENFAQMQGDKKVLMLGAMAELGEQSLAEHQAIIDLIKKYSWKNVALTGGDFMKLDHPFLKFNTSAEAADWFKKQNFQNAQILIKGSRSTRMEKVLEG
jgi:UDP-N-acetylmuramoyl-tripeptide--D-alanyl-D-alanine ligase